MEAPHPTIRTMPPTALRNPLEGPKEQEGQKEQTLRNPLQGSPKVSDQEEEDALEAQEVVLVLDATEGLSAQTEEGCQGRSAATRTRHHNHATPGSRGH